jgi:hypothetical protein
MVGKEEVVELYSSRMWIEESFRDLKQELGSDITRKFLENFNVFLLI